jgi:hypothetical protein
MARVKHKSLKQPENPFFSLTSHGSDGGSPLPAEPIRAEAEPEPLTKVLIARRPEFVHSPRRPVL